MKFLFSALLLALTGAIAVPASAVPLTITKRSQTISDPLGNALPKAIPGAEVDYVIGVSNPNGILVNVAGVAIDDAIPPDTKLRVTSLALLVPGPVEFIDGNLLGLLGSGLTYDYTSLQSTSDALFFSSDKGLSWTYQPIADADGCDALVTNVRVTLRGALVSGSSFNLRFRVRLR